MIGRTNDRKFGSITTGKDYLDERMDERSNDRTNERSEFRQHNDMEKDYLDERTDERSNDRTIGISVA